VRGGGGGVRGRFHVEHSGRLFVGGRKECFAIGRLWVCEGIGYPFDLRWAEGKVLCAYC